MAVPSYGVATKTSGVVRILKDLDHDLEGRHVLLVEDIVDSGLTLSYLLKNLRTRRPKSLEVCALMQKTEVQQVPLNIKYRGFEIPPVFVVALLSRSARPTPISFTEFKRDISQGRVVTAKFLEGHQTVEGKLSDGTLYQTVYPALYEDDLTTQLQDSNVYVQVDPQK